MDKKIYLHIGLEKTGTSAIQKFLNARRKKLLQNGILYPGSLGLPNNDKISAAFKSDSVMNEIKRSYNINNIEDSKNFRKKLMQTFKSEIQTNNPKIIIISNEHISSRLDNPLEIEALINFLREFKEYDLEVIIYLRRQDKLLESLYSTAIMSGNTYTFDTYFNKLYKRHDLNFMSYLQVWQEYIQDLKISIKVYDRKLLNNSDIIHDFMGGIVDQKSFEQLLGNEIFIENQSFGWKKTELLRRINKYFCNNLNSSKRRYIINKMRELKLEDAKITMNCREYLLLKELYEIGNEEVYKAYLKDHYPKENPLKFDRDCTDEKAIDYHKIDTTDLCIGFITSE